MAHAETITFPANTNAPALAAADGIPTGKDGSESFVESGLRTRHARHSLKHHNLKGRKLAGRPRTRASFGRRAAAPARRSLVHEAAPWPESARDEKAKPAEVLKLPKAGLPKSRLPAGAIANMTHELRTPLNSIIGFSEAVLAEKLGPLGDARYRDYIDDILSSGQHLLSLVDDMLDLSKLEAGKRKLNEDEVYLSFMVEAAIRSMAPQAGEADVVIDMKVPTGLPTLWADERALKQILLNLLANAVRFSPKGGTVTVAAGLDGSGRIFLSVADEGPGMSADEIARCLEPFGQVDVPDTANDDGQGDTYQGTGLGLPIVQSLTAAHGGELEIESETGTEPGTNHGTTMTVRLPGRRTIHRQAEITANDNAPAGDTLPGGATAAA